MKRIQAKQAQVKQVQADQVRTRVKQTQIGGQAWVDRTRTEQTRFLPVRLAATWHSRLQGLLRSQPTSEVLLLAPCHGIHTFGMAYPIHVAFLDKAGRVLLSERSVTSGRVLRCPKAATAIECSARHADSWVAVGDIVVLEVAKLCLERNQ